MSDKFWHLLVILLLLTLLAPVVYTALLWLWVITMVCVG